MTGCQADSSSILENDETVSLFPRIADNFPIPLFSSDEVLKLEILSDFPYRTINELEEQGKYAGVLRIGGEENSRDFEVKLEARGSGRLSHCDFAPFKLHLKEDMDHTVFADSHDSLKVVTHCDEGSLSAELDGEETIMTEMLLYKILEKFGVYSFKTRPTQITYKTMDGEPITTKLAFIIENKRYLANRYSTLREFVPDDYSDILSGEIERMQQNGATEAELYDFLEEKLEIQNFLATFLAQIMILNDDWSGTINGANMKTFFDKNGKVVRAHYDLDLSLLTGKFRRGDSLSFESLEYPLPATAETDVEIIQALCNSDEFPFSSEEKLVGCREILPQVSVRQHEVFKEIDNFSLISPERKNLVKERIQTFFTAIRQVQL